MLESDDDISKIFESSEYVNVAAFELVVVVPEDELLPVPEVEVSLVLVPVEVDVPEVPLFHVVVLVPEDDPDESASVLAI